MEARISVKRPVAFFSLGLLTLAAGCDRARQANEVSGNEAVTIDVPRSSGDLPGVTPMAQRVAVLGLLNKRNGIVKDLTLKPGQAIRVKDVTVRLKACEATAPWEAEKLTGAFIQMDLKRPDGRWVRRFSGWLYKESPSLNVVEDPVYDVWPKSCAMSWPEGPAAPAAPVESRSRSSASNSGGGNAVSGKPAPPVATVPSPNVTAPPAAPADNAVDNNPT
jgi:hypothetical protein